MEEALNKLKEAWEQLEEETRKRIFRCVFRDDRTLFNHLSSEMHGYSSKGLSTRPSTIASRLDDLLFSIAHSVYARDFLRIYYVNSDPKINNLFLTHFERLARSSPAISCKKISNDALAAVRKDLGETELLRFYEQILPICAPSRFSEDPPDLDEFEGPVRESHDIKHKNLHNLETTQSEKTTKELAENQAPISSVSEHTPPMELSDHGPPLKKNKASESNDLMERVKAISLELKKMPVEELALVLEQVTDSFGSCTREFQQYFAQKVTLNAVLCRLSERGLRTGDEIFKHSIERVEKLSIERASEELLKCTGQANAILDKTDQFAELAKILGYADDSPLPGIGVAELEALLREIEAKLADKEVAFQRLRESEAILQNFVETLRSCDFKAAYNFVEEIDATYWLKIIQSCFACSSSPLREDQTAETQWQPASIAHRILGDRTLLALIVSATWRKSSPIGITAVQEVHQAKQSGLVECHLLGVALSGLTFTQLLYTANSAPELGDAIGELTLLSALSRKDFDAIRWIGTFAHTPGISNSCRNFLIGVAVEQEHEHLIPALKFLFQRLPSASDLRAKEQAARNTLSVMATHHGAGGNYRKIWEIAQKNFVEPIMLHVGKRNSAGALETWNAFGGFDAMLNYCLQQTDSQFRMEQRHLNKTRQYLVHFGDALEEWVATKPARETIIAGDTLVQAFEELKRKEASQSSVGSGFLVMLESILFDRKAEELLPPPCLGRIAANDGCVSIAYLNVEEQESWILAANDDRDQAPVEAVLVERLLRTFGEPGAAVTHEALLSQLIQKSEVLSASMLVERCPELQHLFEAHIARLRSDVLDQYKGDWEKAKQVAETTEDVALWLGEIERLLDEFQFGEAMSLLPDLMDAVEQASQQESPEYKCVSQWLDEAGVEIPAGAALRQLESKVSQIQDESKERRQHLLLLRAIVASGEYDEDFRDRIAALADELDRPRRWLPPTVSKEITEALGIILSFLRARIRWRESKPEIYRSLYAHMGEFLRVQLNELCGQDKTVDPQHSELIDLALQIEINSLEAEEVIHRISAYVEVPMARPAILGKTDPRPPPLQRPPALDIQISRRANDKEPASTSDVINKLRAFVMNHAEESKRAEIPGDFHAVLRSYCRENRWSDVLSLTASLILEKPEKKSWLTSFEMLFCIAGAKQLKGAQNGRASDKLHNLCLGIIASLVLDDRGESYYYTDRDHTCAALLGAFLPGVQAQGRDEHEPRQYLADALRTLAEVPSSDPGNRWFVDLVVEARSLVVLGKPRSGSGVLAGILWDSLAGLNDPALARSKLLFVGYQLNLEADFVASLAKEHASPLDHHVLQFMRAVRSSEANDAAWDDSRRLAQSFMEQVPPKTMKPWRLFVDDLNNLRKLEAATDICEVSLENCTQVKQGEFSLAVSVIPGKYSVLDSLVLLVGDDASQFLMPIQEFQLIEADNLIPRETIVRIIVQLGQSAMGDSTLVFPYKVNAHSTNGQKFEKRDRWNIDLAETTPRPLPLEVINRCWRGAEGNPVDTKMHAYHGRHEEHERLQQLLSGNDGRQRSAMVIGQRRIGKTSLLIEMLRQYPPAKGHICAVFCQFGGIQKRSSTEPLAQTVFNALTDCTDVTGYNAHFCQLLAESQGDLWLRKLRRGLNPATSIAAALTMFVDRVAEFTGGLVERMAFFADEFQDVFKYDPEEVNQVMWGLRPLVQMSPKISLVLAGSGLTRDLIHAYDKALFGSIATLPLYAFQWPKERDAVANTFIPREAREWLCPEHSKLEGLTQHAHYLTGGHPWFLAMLGSSAAQMLEGRIVTPSLLNEVANGMVTGRVKFQDGETGAAKFYGHLFDSLDAAGRLKSYAQLVLANIARQVTLEWPWLTATQAITGPRIAQSGLSSEECLEALKALKAEDVLDHRLDKGVPKYRIRIPIVASAVGYDADEIEYNALQSLSANP